MGFKLKLSKDFVGSSFVVQWVNDLALSLQQLWSLLCFRFSPWLGNFYMSQVWPKRRRFCSYFQDFLCSTSGLNHSTFYNCSRSVALYSPSVPKAFVSFPLLDTGFISVPSRHLCLGQGGTLQEAS